LKINGKIIKNTIENKNKIDIVDKNENK